MIDTLKRALAALDTGSDAVRNHAEAVHYAYKGYYPERHAAADRDVAEVDAAITSLTALIAKLEARKPVAWCQLSIGGKWIAYFDGNPIIMVGPVGNDCHTTPLYKD